MIALNEVKERSRIASWGDQLAGKAHFSEAAQLVWAK
jgi:hypothetical protein